MDWMKTLLSSGLVKARFKKALNTASIAAGAWTLSHMTDWLFAHATFFSHADSVAIAGTVATCVAGLILTVGSAAYSQFDAGNVNAKLVAVAAAGDIDAASDPAMVKAAKVAVSATPGSQEAVTALTAKLSEGKV